MIFDQTIAKACRLLLEGWIGAGIAKYLEGSVQSRIQKALIPQAGTAASFINQMLMEHQDLALVQDFHLASSS